MALKGIFGGLFLGAFLPEGPQKAPNGHKMQGHGTTPPKTEIDGFQPFFCYQEMIWKPLKQGNGAQGRNRTTDTAIFSRMLYQLSYLGTPLAGGL